VSLLHPLLPLSTPPFGVDKSPATLPPPPFPLSNEGAVWPLLCLSPASGWNFGGEAGSTVYELYYLQTVVMKQSVNKSPLDVASYVACPPPV